MSAELERIKRLRSQDYGTAGLSVDDIDWLIERAERLAELQRQEPAFWYLPAEDEDGEDALLFSLRDGTSPAAGALPLYTAPVPPAAQQSKVPEDVVRDAVALPDHEPTIAIGEILDGYDGDDREDVWDSIKAYADVHARAALEEAAGLVPMRADDVVRDSERWRLVRERGAYWSGPYAAWLVRLPYAETFEQASDAILAAQQQKEVK